MVSQKRFSKNPMQLKRRYPGIDSEFPACKKRDHHKTWNMSLHLINDDLDLISKRKIVHFSWNHFSGAAKSWTCMLFCVSWRCFRFRYH